MKTWQSTGVALIALALLGANALISQDAALVSGALTTLGFEALPGKPDVIGAPPKMRVTKKTLKQLEKLLNEGKIIQVQNNGAIEILAPAK